MQRSLRIGLVPGLGLSLGLAWLLAGSPSFADTPPEAAPAEATVDARCAGVARTQTGFDPRTIPRPVPRQAAATSAAPAPMPPVGIGAHSPPPAIPQQSGFVAQEQARWDAENDRFRRAYEACLAAPPKADPGQLTE